MNSLTADILGWIGAAGVLLAYGLISAERVKGTSVPYQLLNVVGSALLIVNAWHYGAFPSLGVNVVWIVVGLTTLARLRRTASMQSATPS